MVIFFPYMNNNEIQKNIVLKKRLEDFQVHEVVDFDIQETGNFGVYVLKKWGTTTWDVVNDIKKRIRRTYRDISFVGIKDKHAITTQYITILNGPKKNLRAKNYILEYMGQSDGPIQRTHLRGNRFKIKVEVKGGIPVNWVYEHGDMISQYGVANYYDDQRFASVDKDARFPIRELILKRYEKALYYILAQSSYGEARKTKRFRSFLQKNWGSFSECVKLSPPGWEKNVLTLLATKKSSNTTYKKALSMVHKEYLFFLCNSYQSYLWNKVVLEFLESLGVISLRLNGKVCDFGFYLTLDKDTFNSLKQTHIPLPGPKIDVEEPIKDFFYNILKKEGISCIELFRTRIPGAVFKSSLRPIIVFPKIYSLKPVGMGKWVCEFFLPKGAYATLIIKRIFGLYGGINV